MANGGSVSTNKYTYTDGAAMGLKCTWAIDSQSSTDNTSVISWTLESDGASGYSFDTGNISLVIDGTVAYSQQSKITVAGGGAWSKSGTLTVEHDADGTKTLDISIVAGIWAYTSSNCTGADTFELDPIARGLVYIDNGSSFDAYQVYIDNGTAWDLHIPFIDNGTVWEMCN